MYLSVQATFQLQSYAETSRLWVTYHWHVYIQLQLYDFTASNIVWVAAVEDSSLWPSEAVCPLSSHHGLGFSVSVNIICEWPVQRAGMCFFLLAYLGALTLGRPNCVLDYLEVYVVCYLNGCSFTYRKAVGFEVFDWMVLFGLFKKKKKSNMTSSYK